MATMGKIISINRIPAIVRECKKRGGKVGLMTGCFDVLHIGHVRQFKWARKRTDLLIVGLESDRSIALSKGSGRPVFSQNIRAEMVSELTSVDYVFKIRKVYGFNGPSVQNYYDSLLKYIRPDFVLTHFSKDTSVDKKRVLTKKHGIRILLRRENPLSSSTEIVDKIKRIR